jgi:hypothetical protein
MGRYVLQGIMRKFLFVVLLMTGVTMAEEYPESFDVVETKYQLVGLDELNEKEKAIFTIWWLEAEVNNGGFHQYFWNSSGDHFAIALKSLNKIGATKTASLLKQAIEIAFCGSVPLNRDERQKLLEIDEDKKMDALEELDNSFYEYPEDFYKMLNEFGAK